MAFPARPIAHRCNLGLAHSEITVPPKPSLEGTCNITHEPAQMFLTDLPREGDHRS